MGVTNLNHPDRVNKGGRPKRATAQTALRREEVQHLSEEIGIYNIPVNQLATKWNCSKETIYDDIKKLVREHQPEDLKEVKYSFSKAFVKSMKELQKIIATTQDPNMKVKAVDGLNRLLHYYTIYLEEHGIKPKVADKQEITVSKAELLKELLKE